MEPAQPEDNKNSAVHRPAVEEFKSKEKKPVTEVTAKNSFQKTGSSKKQNKKMDINVA